MRRPKLYVSLAILLMLAIGGWAAGLSSFIHSASSPPPDVPLQKLDAIVVLTGGRNRIDTGFDLLERGLGSKLFISGVYRGLEAKQLLKLWKDEPQEKLDCCVVLGFTADNTAGNAVETIEWLHKQGYHSIYLVTANYHMKRALLEFRRVDPDLAITPFPVASDKVDMKNWWQDSTTRSLVLREYTKYVVAYVFHQALG